MSMLQPLPFLEADGETPLDIVFIEGLRGETVIGIHDDELHAPQPLVMDIHAGLPRPAACDTDQIADTIDYSVVRARILRLMAEHRFQLLEAFAEAVADILLDEFGAKRVRVLVAKPQKFADLQAVGVQIDRTASTRTRSARPRLAGGGPVLHLIGAGMVVPRRG